MCNDELFLLLKQATSLVGYDNFCQVWSSADPEYWWSNFEKLANAYWGKLPLVQLISQFYSCSWCPTSKRAELIIYLILLPSVGVIIIISEVCSIWR